MSGRLNRVRANMWRRRAKHTCPSFVCPVCGQKSPCYASFVTLQAGYGSVHDGDTVTVRVCGDCLDWLYVELIDEKKG